MSDPGTDAAAKELEDLLARRQAVMADSAAVRARQDAIRNSTGWRILETYRRMRIKLGISGARPTALHAMLRAKRRSRRVATFVRTAPIGVNVAGYLDTESGMGEAARASIRSIQAAGLPVALNNVPSRLRAQDRSHAGAFVDENPHPFNLVHLNADNMGWFAASRGRSYFRNRYTIGFWFWELSTFRDEWLPFFGYVDEVWVATEFGRAAIQACTSLPVVRMPLPIVLPPAPPLSRAHFGLPESGAVFLYAFDVSSQTERKFPLAAIRAFRRAALARDEAVLVLKFTNAAYDPDAVRRLHQEAAGLNVVMLDGYMDRAELTGLLQAADCYPSPHRAEGFGLTLLEAMSLGKPVVATNYSGNVDFMTAENSYPVDYRLVALTRDYGPYIRGAVWADPDLDQMGAIIRHIAEHPVEATTRGAQAKADVERNWSPAVTGARLRDRLESVRQGRTAI